MCPWFPTLEQADFKSLTWRDDAGWTHHVLRTRGPNFLARCWPVFRPVRRRFRRRSLRKVMGTSRAKKVSRYIVRSARLSAARRWLPASGLEQHQMRVEDVIRARRMPGK